MKTSSRWSRVLTFWLATVSAFHLAALALFAQGTVQFNNTGSTLMTTNSVCCPPNQSGPTQAGYTIGLYIAPQGTTDPSLFQLMGPTATSTGGAFGQGRFNGNPQPNYFVISNNTGQPISFQVRAWSTSLGSTWEQAVITADYSRYLGVSEVGQVTPATNGSPPALFGTSAGQVGGFALIPRGYYVAPTASITAPLNGSLFAAPADISGFGSGYNPDGYLISSYVLTNGVIAGGAPPYGTTFIGFTLSNLAAGHYTLQTRTTSDHLVTTTSAPVTIRVADRPVLEFARGSNGPIQFQFNSATGINYVVERATLTNFSPVITNPGTASPISYSETNGSATQRTYQVRLQ
jgi:hypothetical protein